MSIHPSPYWVQRRLRLVGVRAISNIVDATNYTMFELGEPLHAFDYAVLQQQSRLENRLSSPPVQRKLVKCSLPWMEWNENYQNRNVLVCDSAGALSLAGVMGGSESEVSDQTTDILLEAAAWNFINIRRTATQHALPSEASYRFSRGVHPGLCLDGLKRCLYWMAAWSGGKVAPGIVDEYPLQRPDPVVEITEKDVRRALGIEIPLEQIKNLLERLEFSVIIQDEKALVQTPPIRMDIGTGLVGVADVMEEIARLYGYENIPESRMADPLPPQRGNPALEAEEHIRDLLVSLGLQEVITHRMTSPELENRLCPAGVESKTDQDYVRLANPITPEKRVLRQSLLNSILNVVKHNERAAETIAIFEVGSVFLPVSAGLPDEPHRLAFALYGLRQPAAWDSKSNERVDFFDLKGILELLTAALHMEADFLPASGLSYHPGKCAELRVQDRSLGVFGELHPQVQGNYELANPVIAGELDLDALIALTNVDRFAVAAVSEFPPILEDIAVVVDEAIPAEKVEGLIRQTGGKLVVAVKLFDIFRSAQVGDGKKSLAYNLTYQSDEKTLSDKDAAQIRQKIIRRLEHDLGCETKIINRDHLFCTVSQSLAL